MEKILEIYKDAFKATFGLIKTEGFKFVLSILTIIFLIVFSLFTAGMLAHCSGWLFLLILLGETLLLLPVYVKLFRFLDDY